MKVKPREMGMAFARLLKPGPGKLVIFAFLLAFLVFLPLYPVHEDRYMGLASDDATELEKSGTAVKSLYIVLEGDFNWTETIITTRIVIETTVEDYHLSYFDANPLYISIYGGLGFLAYFVSSYYIESAKREKGTGQ